MIYQAITTTYRGPTNHRGARILAKTGSGFRKTVAWDYELGPAENHVRAAKMLADQIEWSGSWHTGALHGASYAHVCTDPNTIHVSFSVSK